MSSGLRIEFFVPGVPAPQGSKTPNRGGYGFHEASKRLKPWRDLVHYHAKAALPVSWPPLVGPLRMTTVFALPRPKKVPTDRCGWPTTTPDLSKLIRAVEDSCTTAKVWGDDAQVCEHRTRKVYVGDGGTTETGVLVIVERLAPMGGSR